MGIFSGHSFLNRNSDKHLVRISTTGSEQDAFYFEVDFSSEYSISHAFSMFHSQKTLHVIVFKSGVTLKTWAAALETKADFDFLKNMILAERVFKTETAVKEIRQFA